VQGRDAAPLLIFCIVPTILRKIRAEYPTSPISLLALVQDDIIPSTHIREEQKPGQEAIKHMGKKLTVLFLTLVVFVGISGGYVVGGLQAYFRYQHTLLCGGLSPVHICVPQLSQSPILSAFYPSYVAKHTTIFTIIYSSDSPKELVINVSIKGFSQVQTQTVNATPTERSANFTPPLISHNVLRTLTSDENALLHVQVTDVQGHLFYEDDSSLVLLSRLSMQWQASTLSQIAAWVTPNDPAIAPLIAKAAVHLPQETAPAPDAMIGYNGGNATPQDVKDQVDAIFDALRLDYHIHYVQEDILYGGPHDTKPALQLVKLPADVLQQRSGMCVELTVLLASAVESIGLHAELIIIPDHMFLGVAVTPDNKHFEYWDTVLVNKNDAGESVNILTDGTYMQHLQQHTIVDTILIDDARNDGIGPMV